LLKAFKVAMRDKNVAICVLSVVALLLALRPGSSPAKHSQSIMTNSAHVQDVVMDTSKMLVRHPIGMATEAPQVTGDVVKDAQRDAPMVKANSHVAHERITEVQ
jgi:hypothetical protein